MPGEPEEPAEESAELAEAGGVVARRRLRRPRATAIRVATVTTMPTTSFGVSSSLRALASSTITSAARTSPAGARDDTRAPISTPGIEPSRTAPAMSSWRSPKKAWPIAAAATSGTACTRSVPTRSLARSIG